MTHSRLGFLFLCCATSLSLTTQAQAETSPPVIPPRDETGLALYLFLGHAGWNAAPIEAPLAALGYASFSPDPGSGGVGLRGWTHGWTGALEFQFAMATASAEDGRRLSLESGQFMVHAGRVLAATSHFQTYVLAGMGYGSTSLAPDTGSLPPRYGSRIGLAPGKTVSNFALALQGLVGVDYHLAFPGGKRGFNGFVLGLRAGYNAQPAVSSWYSSASSAPAGSGSPVALPRVAEDGPFVHLVLGDLAVGR